jgi:hypothetical protein
MRLIRRIGAALIGLAWWVVRDHTVHTSRLPEDDQRGGGFYT